MFKKILLILFIINVSMVCAQEQPPARVVVSKIVFQKVAQNQSFIGTLYYERISHVSSEVSGLVSRIGVMAGDQVKKDASLVQLDTEILEMKLCYTKIRLSRQSSI